MLVIVTRLELTLAERAGLAYAGPAEVLADLALVQESLVAAGTRGRRTASCSS
jgi:phosphoenolpyruvate carboxylase